MSRGVRSGLFLVSAAGLTALLLWAVADLPDFGHYRGPYGKVLNSVAVGERHTTNVVAAVVFDYRGVDTMGEEFILFASVMGVALLLRNPHRERRQVPAQGERLSHVGVHTRFVQKLSLTYYTHNISLRLFFTSASSRVSALS